MIICKKFINLQEYYFFELTLLDFWIFFLHIAELNFPNKRNDHLSIKSTPWQNRWVRGWKWKMGAKYKIFRGAAHSRRIKYFRGACIHAFAYSLLDISQYFWFNQYLWCSRIFDIDWHWSSSAIQSSKAYCNLFVMVSL